MHRREFVKCSAMGALALLTGGCGAESPPARSAGFERRNYNIVLLTVDSWNPFHLGCYGYSRETSPALDAFARKHCVRFTAATTPSGWTLPAFVSLQSGCHVLRHRVTNMNYKLRGGTPAFAELIRESGAHTTSFMGETYGYLKPLYGFDRGFEKTVVVDQQRIPKMTAYRMEGARLFLERGRYDDAAAELKRLKKEKKPFFFWKYTNDAHLPYVAVPVEENPFQSPEDVERLARGEPLEGTIHAQLRDSRLDAQRDVGFRIEKWQAVERIYNNQYDGGLRLVDDGLAKILAELEDVLDDTVVLITADHGEAMAEPHHGPYGIFYTHGQPYETCNRIPFLIHAPGIKPGVCDALVQLQDIAPTLLDMTGQSPPAHMDGRSLVGLLTGEVDRVRDIAVSRNGWSLARNADGMKAITAPGGWDPYRKQAGPKVTFPRELYDTRTDPEERENLYVGDRTLHEGLMQAYEAAEANLRAPMEQERIPDALFDADHMEELEALGYL